MRVVKDEKALKVKEGAHEPRNSGGWYSWKRLGKQRCPEPTGRNAVLLMPDFSPVRCMSDFLPCGTVR